MAGMPPSMRMSSKRYTPVYFSFLTMLATMLCEQGAPLRVLAPLMASTLAMEFRDSPAHLRSKASRTTGASPSSIS